LLGLGNYGGEIAKPPDRAQERRFLGVDFDPQNPCPVASAGAPGRVRRRRPTLNCSISCPSMRARWIVSTVRDRDLNITLLRVLKTRRLDGKLAVAARDESEACGTGEQPAPTWFSAPFRTAPSMPPMPSRRRPNSSMGGWTGRSLSRRSASGRVRSLQGRKSGRSLCGTGDRSVDPRPEPGGEGPLRHRP
jgi:hypothetical protein